MARMPGAQWRPLPTSGIPMRAYDITCFHTMVGSLAGTDNYFRTSAAGTNSHFGVGFDGTIYQWVDTAYRSGANYDGNYHIVSVETADIGPGFPAWNTNDGSQVPAWTDEQIDACARIAAWAHDVHGIPLALIPDSKVGRRGVAYHRLGVPGYMVAGGEQWSTKFRKACPGDRRIAQIPQVIARASGQEEDDMPYTEAQLLDIVRRAVASAPIAPSPGGIGGTESRSLQAMVGRLLDDASAASQGVARLAKVSDPVAFAQAMKPILLEAVQAGMAADNDEQADAIVDRLAARLGSAA